MSNNSEVLITTLSDDELRAHRDALEVIRKNLYEQKLAWEAGDMIGYGQEWAGRLRGRIGHFREELQTVKTELRRRGLIQPHVPMLPTPESRRWIFAKREALEAAMDQMLPPEDVAAIKGLAANIYQEMWDTAARNRETSGRWNNP